jgi:hypothetical protein
MLSEQVSGAVLKALQWAGRRKHHVVGLYISDVAERAIYETLPDIVRENSESVSQLYGVPLATLPFEDDETVVLSIIPGEVIMIDYLEPAHLDLKGGTPAPFYGYIGAYTDFCVYVSNTLKGLHGTLEERHTQSLGQEEGSGYKAVL